MTQSVKDALADAETLRRMLHSMWDGYSGYGGHTLLDDAERSGNMAIAWIAIPNAVGDGAEYHASEAARAAFRAVPALREPECRCGGGPWHEPYCAVPALRGEE